MGSRPVIVLLLQALTVANLAGAGAASGELVATVTPAAAGQQLVRLSVPFPPGMLAPGQSLAAWDGCGQVAAALRPLSWHPAGRDGRSLRRGLVTFPYQFADCSPVRFHLRPGAAAPAAGAFPVEVRVTGDQVTIAYRQGPLLRARLLAPQVLAWVSGARA